MIRIKKTRFVQHTCYSLLSTGRVSSLRSSLFTYEDGRNFAFYNHPEYKPQFLGDKTLKFSNKNLEFQARSACGNNIQCVFDIRTTNKVAIGKATKEATEEYTALIRNTDLQGNGSG